MTRATGMVGLMTSAAAFLSAGWALGPAGRGRRRAAATMTAASRSPLTVEGLGELTRGVRLVLERRDGRPSTFRFYSVRPESAAARLGLRAGDRLTRVAGVPVSSAETALAAYHKARSVRRFTVEVEREGGRVEREVQLG